MVRQKEGQVVQPMNRIALVQEINSPRAGIHSLLKNACLTQIDFFKKIVTRKYHHASYLCSIKRLYGYLIIIFIKPHYEKDFILDNVHCHAITGY